jgi:hypothetical protein
VWSVKQHLEGQELSVFCLFLVVPAFKTPAASISAIIINILFSKLLSMYDMGKLDGTQRKKIVQEPIVS